MSKKIKTNILIVLIFVFPFLFIICINEGVRDQLIIKKYVDNGAIYMNSSKADPLSCTWKCHNDTKYCKKNHVKYMTNLYRYTDPMYFGIINGLKRSGSYRLANIVVLVILLPLLMFILLLKSIVLQCRINQIKKKL